MKSVLILLLALQASAAETSSRDAIFAKSVEAMFPQLVEIRRDIHAHPELSNEEIRTAALVSEKLKSLGLAVSAKRFEQF